VHLEVGAVPGQGIPLEEEIHGAVVVLEGAWASALGAFEGEELLEQFLPGGGLVGTESDDLGSVHDGYLLSKKIGTPGEVKKSENPCY